MEKNITVIGGGSWGTAIVKMLCNNTEKVHWWMRNTDAVAHIKQFHHNPNYLQSVQFDLEKLEVTNDLVKAVEASNIIIIVTPSAFLVELFKDFSASKMQGKLIFSAVKGIVPEYHEIPARYFNRQFDVSYDNIGIICGPCHAEEVAMEKLSYLTIACQNEANAALMAGHLACRYVKTYLSDDLFGTELSAILKNVFAVASGICHGLRYGDNFQAVLITNAIQEIERFVDKVNPIHRDVKTSGYLGDLLVTAYSQFSRNRVFGTMIGKGYSVKAAQLEMDMVAEGYYAVESIYEMNKKYKVDMPITTAVYNILYEKISPMVEMRILADKLQ